MQHSVEFDPGRDQELFAALPAAPAVFVLRGEGAAEPYISKTANLRRRLERLLGAPEEGSKRLNLRERVRRVEYTPSGSDFESVFLLYRTLRQLLPGKYRERMKLRLAPLVRCNLDNPYPRAYVTRRIVRGEKSLYYGPFPSRAAAEKFLNDALDLFKMRRCDFDLDPDPQYPGCIYSEMKMCLAPCFRGCTDEQYRAEVARVQAFLDSSGRSLVRELEEQREQAAAALEFEGAAAIHQRIEKVRGVAHLPEIVRRLDQVSGLVVQPSAEPDAVALFRVQGGCVAEPLTFPLQQKEGKMVSMESRIEQALATAPPAPQFSAAERMEHLAMLKRWFYRSSKIGELFLVDERGELPMRRLVRGISRVFRGEKPETTPVSSFTAEHAEKK